MHWWARRKLVYKYIHPVACLHIIFLQTAAGIFTANVTAPKRGDSLRMTCSAGADQLRFFNPTADKAALSSCSLNRSQCFGGHPGYIFGANASFAWVDIISLNRTRDQDIWLCVDGKNNSQTITLTVYSSPLGIDLVSPLLPAADLAEVSIALQCETRNCGYPEPAIVWYYQTDSGPVPFIGGTTIKNNKTGNCTQQEMIYISKLELSLGTNFSGNIPQTTNLQCGISHPVLDIVKYSGFSNSITFAVSLTSVNIMGTTDVTQGMESTFTCMTSISRPTATVIWFIGNTTVGTGIKNSNRTDSNGMPFVESMLTFRPDGIIHHGQQIHCQAITRFDFVTSANLTLFVRVSLTHVNISGTKDITQGIESSFTCTTSISRPTAVVLWFIENTTVTTGIQNINMTDINGLPYVESVLTFDPNGTFHHRKRIICQALTPSDVVYSAELTLYVTVYVTSITLNPAESNITFLEEEEKTLSCTSSLARPQPIIRWWLDGLIQINGSTEKTTANGSLESVTSKLCLKLNKTYQNKHIFCDAQVDGQPSPVNSSISTINIWYKPASSLVETVNVIFPWLENRTGILRCVTTDRGNPPASVIWKSSRGIKDSDENLVFSNLSYQDHGKTVTCQLQNNFTILKNVTIVSPNVTLNVEYTPIITVTPADNEIRVKETSLLNVICTGTGNPNPKLEWLGRDPLSNVLHIPDVQRNSTGTYICRASSTSTNFRNVTLSREKSTVIIIEYAPDVAVNLTGPTVINSTVLLMCIPIGEPSHYTFHQWVHKVGELEIRRLTGNNTANASILTLPNISIEDMGTYMCTVNNSITGLDGQINQTGHTDVFVHGPPFLGEKELIFTGVTNKSGKIEIPFYSNSAVRTVKFTRHSGYGEISNTSDTSIYISSAEISLTFYKKMVMLWGYNAVLFFPTLKDTYFDNYTLHLANDQGSTSVDFYFIASAPPSVPKKFVLSHFEDGFPVFELEKGFNGGHTQTFVIEYQPIGMPVIEWTSVLEINESSLGNRSLNGTYFIPLTHIPDGHYIFRVYAKNEKGNSIVTEGIEIKIQRALPASNTKVEFPVAAVAGGIGAVVIAFALVVIALVVIKRRTSPKRKGLTQVMTSTRLGSRQISTYNAGLVDNPVYESSGLRPDPSTSMGVEYAAVVKPKKSRKATMEEDTSNLYAQVHKKKQKKKKGDVYENAELTSKTFNQDNVYENSGDVTTKTFGLNVCESPGAAAFYGQVANKDDLLYADLMLDPPTTRNGKLVIRGLENRTKYAEIAYSKRREPLPENDNEKDKSGTNQQMIHQEN